jgi:hypothetical protein
MQSACLTCFLVPAAPEVPSKADRLQGLEADLEIAAEIVLLIRPNETFIQVERTGAYGIVHGIATVGERLARWLLMAQPAWAVTGYLLGVAPAG